MIRLFYFLVFFYFFSCNQQSNDLEQLSSHTMENDAKEYLNTNNNFYHQPKLNVLNKEESIEMNKMMHMDESFRINKYCKRHGWEMIETKSGVFYSVLKNGTGHKTSSIGDSVKLNYEVRLLDVDQTLCYSSLDYNINGVDIVLGKSPLISGLHTAISYLMEGDSAIVVLPQFLAYGIAGDNEKIPMYQPLLFYLSLLDVKG